MSKHIYIEAESDTGGELLSAEPPRRGLNGGRGSKRGAGRLADGKSLEEPLYTTVPHCEECVTRGGCYYRERTS